MTDRFTPGDMLGNGEPDPRWERRIVSQAEIDRIKRSVVRDDFLARQSDYPDYSGVRPPGIDWWEVGANVAAGLLIAATAFAIMFRLGEGHWPWQ